MLKYCILLLRTETVVAEEGFVQTSKGFKMSDSSLES